MLTQNAKYIVNPQRATLLTSVKGKLNIKMCGRHIKASLALTACVFKAVDSIGQKADTAQEASSLLLMDLLVIPHADGDGV